MAVNVAKILQILLNTKKDHACIILLILEGKKPEGKQMSEIVVDIQVDTWQGFTALSAAGVRTMQGKTNDFKSRLRAVENARVSRSLHSTYLSVIAELPH
jgi:hypothetical protein